MTTPIKIKIEMAVDLVTPRTHAKIMRDINRKQGEKHKSKTILKHFENVPETRPGGAYGYEKRGQRYAFRKQKAKGHRRPNVFSGRMRETILSSSIVRATQTRWTFQAKNYFPMRLAQRDEIEAVAPGEIGQMVREMRADYINACNRPENRRRRRVKIKR